MVMLVRNTFTHDTRVEKEARTLAGAGYRVTVVADAAPGLPDSEDRKGIHVVRVGRAGPPLPFLRFALHEARLARMLRRLRPSILHAHDSNALIPIALAAIGQRLPYVYDAHDLWLGRPRRERSRAYFWLQQAYYGAVERLTVPRAAVTLTVSPPIVTHLQSRYGLGQVRLVPNYPELSDGEPRDLRRLSGGQRIPPEARPILYLGGLMAGRGIEQLLDALPSVPAGHLVLLGSGVLAPDLHRRAWALGVADRVHLLGEVPSDEVVAYAASAAIGVSPIVPSSLNYRYSLPNKLFQYMAAALPVVASDFRQVREVVEGCGCGVVVDTTDPAAVAAAINGILDDPVAARAMGERGRAAVEERYNWDVSAAELLGAYATLHRGHGS